MSYFTEPTYQAARKPHRCEWCGETIDVGLLYSRQRSYIDNEDPMTCRLHLECEQAMHSTKPDCGVYWMDGDSPRGGVGATFDVATYEQALAAYEARKVVTA